MTTQDQFPNRYGILPAPNQVLTTLGKGCDNQKAIENLCEGLLRLSITSSKISSSQFNATKTLTEQEAKMHVGWLHKNLTSVQRDILSKLSFQNLRHPWEHPWWHEIQRKSKARISRMRSKYQPVSETQCENS